VNVANDIGVPGFIEVVGELLWVIAEDAQRVKD
jgi:hypothetical protein